MIWLSQLLNVGCFGVGAYRSLKTLKDGEVDFELLVFFCVIGSMQLFSQYFEWLVCWFPFYSIAKSCLLLLMLIPKLRVPRFLFHTLIIPFMTLAYEKLDQEIPRGMALIETLPSTIFVGVIDLFIPGMFTSGDDDDMLGDDNETKKVNPIRRGSAEDVAKIKEVARSKRTTRDLMSLNRKHHISERHDAVRAESLPRSPDSTHSSPNSSPFSSPMSPPQAQPLKTPPSLDLKNSPHTPQSPKASSSISPAKASSYVGNLARKVLTGSKDTSLRAHFFDVTEPPNVRTPNPARNRPTGRPASYGTYGGRSPYDTLPKPRSNKSSYSETKSTSPSSSHNNRTSGELRRPRLFRSRGSAEFLRESLLTDPEHSPRDTPPKYIKPSKLVKRRNGDTSL